MIMTVQEAIEELKYDCEQLGKSVPCDTSCGTSMNEAYKMAISALERQIRKKMTCKTDFTHKIEAKKFRDISGSCPGCGHRHDKGELWTKYCPWCGQAIDWN